MKNRTPVLKGSHITVRFGEGCPYCREHTELEMCIRDSPLPFLFIINLNSK